MKNLLYLLALTLLLASCDQVIFPEPQPKKAKVLKEIPEEMWGFYLDQNEDTLIVYSHSYYFSEQGLMGPDYFYLSDSVVLKYYYDRYFMNIRVTINDQNYYITYIVEMLDNGKTLKLFGMDPEDIVKLAKLQEITSKVEDIEDEGTYYLFDPKKKDYKKIINDTIFSEMYVYRKIEN
jgi:hypothetical protein